MNLEPILEAMVIVIGKRRIKLDPILVSKKKENESRKRRLTAADLD